MKNYNAFDEGVKGVAMVPRRTANEFYNAFDEAVKGVDYGPPTDCERILNEPSTRGTAVMFLL
jgi:hypothetical protein